MTRVLSYNILIGATRRIDRIENMLRTANADLVGLVEATDPEVVEELARRLGMYHAFSARGTHELDWQMALLSRFPIVFSHVHYRPDTSLKPVLEVCVEEPGGQQLTVFVTHLTAAFRKLWAGDSVRRREVRELLDMTASLQGAPHLIMGDFNSLAPGDSFKASALVRYVLDLDLQYEHDQEGQKGQPHLEFVLPEALYPLKPLVRLVPRSKMLSALLDAFASSYALRGSIALLRNAGYVDCFRALHPGEDGFTCPAALPAGRIDFIFASPEMAQRLSGCRVIANGKGVLAQDASDHLPVLAEFGAAVALQNNDVASGAAIEQAVL